MGTIESRSRGLLNFVQSYRQLTRVPRPNVEMISVQELLGRIAELMSPRFEERGVELLSDVFPESLEITADSGQIEQVLINLVQNALDWAGRKPNGRVRMCGSMGAGGRPVIQVFDNGPGIQAEALEKIFIPFFTTKEDGSGIGLSLSRQIMRGHKGTITAQSKPNEETVFSLRF